jgi:peptidoglycan glycosyltransferase
MSVEMAGIMRQDMIGVVQGGTARGLQIPGYEVGGKTGTAQVGSNPPTSHTWIIGFAGPPGQPASVAVAVVVLNQSGNNEATGGVVAAPIARAVMEKVLQVQYGG